MTLNNKGHTVIKICGLLALIAALATSCVDPNVPLAFAQRAHPECEKFLVLAHSYDGEKSDSLTEINMKCGEFSKSVTVKCRFGFGCISDTVCHENN